MTFKYLGESLENITLNTQIKESNDKKTNLKSGNDNNIMTQNIRK